MFRPDRPLAWLLAAVAGLTLLAGTPCAAEDPDEARKRLQSIEKNLDAQRAAREALEREAKALDREVASIQRRLVEAGAKASELDVRAIEAEDRLEFLLAEEARKREVLMAERGRNVRVLAALERLARHPPEALIVQPLSTGDLVRSAIVLRASVPRLQDRARNLREELDALTETRTDLAAEQAELAALGRELSAEATRIDELLAEKRRLQARLSDRLKREAARARELAREADSLQGLVNRLEAEAVKRREAEAAEAATRAKAARPEAAAAGTAALPRFEEVRPEGSKPIASARGALWMPVAGAIVTRYGEREARGLTSKGITIDARPGSRVVAPYDGRVAYAGPFRGYGQLLIIEHGDGYHTLIAGFDRIDAVVGQWLLAGEPVGIMAQPASDRPLLYVELRRDGQPINPLPWLAVRTGMSK